MSEFNPICPFCSPGSMKSILAENELTYSIFDSFPVNKGHVLIIPKRHCGDYFDLNEEEQSSCWKIVNEVKELISSRYNPDGFNIGINISESAGQTIHHVHIHLIPRYSGDVPDPEGGVRGVVPSKRKYR